MSTPAILQLGLFLLVLLALAWPLSSYITRVMQGKTLAAAICGTAGTASTAWPVSAR
jgi:K+-transporting ATPase A subunit